MKTKFYCDRCRRNIVHDSAMATGYGITAAGEKNCFECCAAVCREEMDRDGRTFLYLEEGHVSNWPGTLKYKIQHQTTGRHNIAGTRHDVWFRDYKGAPWWGVQYGENTQICHCKRLKGAA